MCTNAARCLAHVTLNADAVAPWCTCRYPSTQVNLIYGDKVRAANEPISETEFEPNAPQNRTFIHLQIDNVPWTEVRCGLDATVCLLAWCVFGADACHALVH